MDGMGFTFRTTEPAYLTRVPHRSCLKVNRKWYSGRRGDFSQRAECLWVVTDDKVQSVTMMGLRVVVKRSLETMTRDVEARVLERAFG